MSLEESLGALLGNAAASTTLERWIGAVGFPIVAFFVLCFLIFYMMKQHTAESKEWQAAINRNSEAIEALTEKIRKEG